MNSFKKANKASDEAFEIISDALSERKKLAAGSEEKQKNIDLDFIKEFRLKQRQDAKERFFEVKNSMFSTLEKISE